MGEKLDRNLEWAGEKMPVVIIHPPSRPRTDVPPKPSSQEYKIPSLGAIGSGGTGEFCPTINSVHLYGGTTSFSRK